MNKREPQNQRQETSTIIKLKLDNSRLKIAEPREENPMPSLSEDKKVTQIKRISKKTGHAVPLNSDNTIFEKDFQSSEDYLENAASFNKNLDSVREKLESFRDQLVKTRPSLSGPMTSINASQIPVLIRIPNGGVFYGSNDKMEPQITHVSSFVNLNIKTEHSEVRGERSGFRSFTPRRRRRGVHNPLKMVKY